MTECDREKFASKSGRIAIRFANGRVNCLSGRILKLEEMDCPNDGIIRNSAGDRRGETRLKN